MSKAITKAVVLISGRGSNLQSIIDAIHDNKLSLEVCAVISNVCDAYGLQRAKSANIDTVCIENRNYSDRDSYDQALRTTIDQYEPDLLILAGFMRILTPKFVQFYQGRILNIHPSLLPKYQGLNTHKKVLASHDCQHGASVHFVTEDLDAGPIIIQAKVPVLENDTVNTLSERVLQQEHKIYPIALQWFAQKRLKLVNNTVYLDDIPLNSPVDYSDCIN